MLLTICGGLPVVFIWDVKAMYVTLKYKYKIINFTKPGII
jgi:hypothetical protein